MRILCKVAAKFEHPANHSVFFEIKPNDRLVLCDAPDWLADVLLFQWLLNDGSIEVVGGTATQK